MNTAEFEASLCYTVLGQLGHGKTLTKTKQNCRVERAKAVIA